MLRLSSIGILLSWTFLAWSQSPHGTKLRVDCASCHSTAGWEILRDTFFFNHDTLGFPLEGTHQQVDCRACHQSLVFEEAESACISCHNDIHQQTVGSDCARCHTSDSWLVNNTTEIHEDNGFPLMGSHASISCFECHQSESTQRFDRLGNDCINCHREDYEQTGNPNHQTTGFSTDCGSCHTPEPNWRPAIFGNHDDFYPLLGAHKAIESNCAACHPGGDYANTPNTCVGCHQEDYDQAVDPNHRQAQFSTDCRACHNESGWSPSTFDHDNQYFPIYSGSHEGEWNQCADCHTNPNNYKEFTCIACHTNPETDREHRDVNGYVYSNDACFACHPRGEEDDNFNHNSTGFILDGGHIGLDCASCHFNGFDNASGQCASCHTPDYERSLNPNHPELALSTDCMACHTTEPEWKPAKFDVHNDYYALEGAHAGISNECATCHNGDYINTPNSCYGCHAEEYDQALNPNHSAAQFSTDCASCHSQTAWVPSTFDHDGQFFPIYSGKHQGEWVQCVDCHTNPGNIAEYTCITCHANPETDNQHQGVGGYQYQSPACLACHPTGDADDGFDHNTTAFPLTGAHQSTDCAACHANGYQGTPTACEACHLTDFESAANPNHLALGLQTDCAGCHSTQTGWSPASFDVHDDFYPLTGAHLPIANECAICHNGNYVQTPNDCAGCHIGDFNQTQNPNHQVLDLPTDCAACHTTEPDWKPAGFDIHQDFYPLNGAHAIIADNCAACHNGDYTNTPSTCAGCHQDDYNQTTNPNHQASQFSTDCISCHSETAWTPATFDHDDQYFPIYSGKHQGEWDQCIDCHTEPNNFTFFTCITCHKNPETDNEHQGIGGYLYESGACLSCHPTGDAATGFDHNATNFPLTGVHANIDCISCHANGYQGTPTDCASCHSDNFNQTTNPNHLNLGFPTDCALCHTTDQGWTPATLPNHDDYYVLTGAHLTIADQCASCHAGNYSNTPNTCAACHNDDYLAAANPDHRALTLSNDCAECHTTAPGWEPASFAVHNDYYTLNGAHANIANDCATCHQGNYTNTPNTCAGCHQEDFNNTSNPNHTAAQFSTDCISCHGESSWTPANFDHDAQYFPIYSGEHQGEWDQCLDCHTDPGNYRVFTCTSCHINPETDNLHAGIGGYNYNSNSCFICHPNGRADDGLDHNATGFPLTGAHIAADCLDCHANGFQGTPTNCFACHEPDFNQSSNPNHPSLGLSTDCAGCHTTESGWSPAGFSNHDDFFALTGAHLAISNDCAACHQGNYNNTPNTCAACHTDDFNQASNPNHASLGFSTDCAACHTTEPGWAPATLTNHDDYFPLTGAHLPIANDCATCHNGNYNNTPNTCAACHTDDFNQATNPNHIALGFSNDCATCHVTEPDWQPASFANHNDFYALNGAHAAIANDCAACHQGNYNNTPNTCFGCHSDDYNNTTNPNHSNAQFSTDCAACHSENAWSPANFDHDGQYFPIYSGTHLGEWNACLDCHTNTSNFADFTCITCHANPETDNEHAGIGGYFYTSQACLACHPTGESNGAVDHNATGFPLTGGHLGVDCASCHLNGYTGTPTNCDACHLQDFNQTVNPNHSALGFSTDCASCHTTDPGWNPANLPNHDDFYALTGAHLPIANDCAACHNGNYNNTPSDCAGCHTDDYNQSTNPNHQALGFSTDCASCHTTEPGWNPATLANHDDYYPLTGAHLSVASDCAACHNGNYNNTPSDCAGCHMDDYNQSSNPGHPALGIPTDCASCHTTNADWQPATFDIHDDFYPLTGAHLSIANDCANCHNGNYNNTPNDCAGCHIDNYNQTTNPNHPGLGFSTDCAQCHTTEPDWNPALMPNHNAYYPLNGAHATIANDCAVCHNGNYNNTPNTCAGCHISDYNNTSNPDHSAAQFPTDCAQCHTESAWIPSTFDHNIIYPLNGAHAAISNDCNACHMGNYNNTPNTCYGCHASDYNQSSNPNHVAANLPTDCTQCHTETSWVPSTFNHSTYWVFAGAHVSIANDCNACHMGNYNNTPNTCNGCHNDDYNTANNPNHLVNQFPTDCEQCHTQNAWEPSTFNHDAMYFPIFSGKHEGEWNLCVDCHTSPGNFSSFSCIDCHEHSNQSQVNDDHSGVSGYSYNSNACYTCHPTGED